jgi:predicted nucleic acid-binding protein
VIAADTSVVVAAFASWHEWHEAADRALSGGTRLVAQSALEVYSVLTRLPPPHRAPAPLVRDFLDARFPEPYLALPPSKHRALVATLVGLGIIGGATYDALISVTAANAGATLLSCDLRAATTYERCGVRVSLLDGMV